MVSGRLVDGAGELEEEKDGGGGGGGGGGGCTHGQGKHRRITTEGDVDVAEDDICCFDWGLLTEPVTLLCGHTFCRHW